MSEDPCAPSVTPGFRVPHVPISLQGKPLSLHDLTGRDFALIAGRKGGHWMSAATRFAATTGFRFMPIESTPDLPVTQDFQGALRLADEGALLIRPDGFVAWRADGGAQGAEEDRTRKRVGGDLC